MTSATRISTTLGLRNRLTAWTDGSVATEPFGFIVGKSAVKGPFEGLPSVAQQAIELRDILALCEDEEFARANSLYNGVLRSGSFTTSVERERAVLALL